MNELHGEARWTAYVLSEIDAGERARMEEELAVSADAREVVHGLRESAGLLAGALDMLPPLQFSQRERACIARASRTADGAAVRVVGSSLAAEGQAVWRRLAFGGMTAGVLGVAAAARIAAQWPPPSASSIESTAAGFIQLSDQRPDAAASEMRLELVTEATNTPASFAISPDGRTIAYVAMRSSFGPSPLTGESELMVRRLDDVSARALARGHLTALPFWSPDGRSVGFFADGKLKRLDLAGGSPMVLANALQPRGGTWGADGTILFAPRTGGPIMRIPASGGTPTPATSLRPEQEGHHRPQFISDERFLFHVSGGERSHGIHVATIKSSGTHRVDADAAQLHVPSRHLVFVRNGTLMAQRFDANRLAVAGVVHTIAENGSARWHRRRLRVRAARGSGYRPMAGAGRSGVRMVRSSFHGSAGHIMSSRLRVGEQGLQVSTPVPLFPAEDQAVVFSPDGRYIAFGYRPLVILLNWAPRS